MYLDNKYKTKQEETLGQGQSKTMYPDKIIIWLMHVQGYLLNFTMV